MRPCASLRNGPVATEPDDLVYQCRVGGTRNRTTVDVASGTFTARDTSG